jgi:hypothetical protein
MINVIHMMVIIIPGSKRKRGKIVIYIYIYIVTNGPVKLEC